MPPTTAYSAGDVVLVPFPFTDQSAAKRRPAVVISVDRYNRERPDVIIMAITSQARAAAAAGEFRLTSWKEAGLLKPSVVKPVITTIQQTLILRRPATRPVRSAGPGKSQGRPLGHTCVT